MLDEPFESVDPVSSANLKDILIEYARTGGTVIISSHVMALVEKMCTHVAVINQGQVCAAGTVEEVAAGEDLEDRFLQLVGGRHAPRTCRGWMAARTNRPPLRRSVRRHDGHGTDDRPSALGPDVGGAAQIGMGRPSGI